MSYHKPSGKGRGLITVALVAVLVIGTVSFIALYSGIPLCIGCPTTVQYNPPGSSHTLKSFGSNGVTTTQTLTGGTQTWPIGSAFYAFSVSNPNTGSSFGTWDVVLPGDRSFGASSSYVFSSSYSGTAFLSASNNAQLWNLESGTMGNANPVVINNTYTSSVSSPTACNAASSTNRCNVTWYLNRYYFTVDMKVNGGGLYIACDASASCQSYSCFVGYLCNNSAYDTAFQSAMTSALATINSVSHESTPTTLSLQVNLPPLPGGQSNSDTAGIVALWTAPACTAGSATPQGGGTATGDLCTTGCAAPAGCSIVPSQVHTPLKLFQDSGLSQAYLPACNTFLNLPSYTAAQLAGTCSSSLLGSVYTTIPITDFGGGFSPGPSFTSCGITNFRACWTVSQPEAVLTILVDVLTSNHIYQQYATPAPTTGTSAGTITGQVVDGSLFWHPGVPGASVCLTDITQCASVDTNGNFVLSNIPAGQHILQATAPTYIASGQLSVSVNTGSTTGYGQISLAESNPWYAGNLCTSTPFGSVCIPWLLVFTIIGAIVLVAVVIVVVYGGGKRVAVDAASRTVRRLVPTNPLSERAQGFVARRIAQEINAGTKPKKAQAIAFSEARQRGYHVPPPPKN